MSVLSLIPEDRKKDFQRKESLENVYSSGSRLSLLNKRKKLNPLGASVMSNHSLNSKAGGDRYVTQRVLSAKTHRVKQLQNQLADAHYQLQELSNENRMLRAIQKKQEIALQRYENSNAELPTVLNSHNEDMRIQQSKYKQLKAQFKEVSQKLKEKDLQLQQLKDEHQHLLDLSKDKNLPERERLQSQVHELTSKVQQQNETITMLQRRMALEAKNFRHQLQMEINKHKDTRHDLDLAISNADKLSTIIEMKEKMLNTVASRYPKQAMKVASTANIIRSKSAKGQEIYGINDRTQIEQNVAKLCETSRNLSSVLSHDDEISSSAEPRSRYTRSHTNSTSNRTTPNQTRKNSRGSDDIIELAKTVQDGMADLAIFDDDLDLKGTDPDEIQKKLEGMKTELLNKIKKKEEVSSRKTSALRRQSTEESIEEQVVESDELERPKSRGQKSNVSFYEDVPAEETTTTITINNYKTVDEIHQVKVKRENSIIQKRTVARPIDKYCKEIVHDIEKSNKVIDKHIKEFSDSKLENEKIVEQLQAVDKINEFMNSNGEIPEETLIELNNNFQKLSDDVLTEIPTGRKRSVSGRRNGIKLETNMYLFGDSNLSNKDLLEDLLGKK